MGTEYFTLRTTNDTEPPWITDKKVESCANDKLKLNGGDMSCIIARTPDAGDTGHQHVQTSTRPDINPDINPNATPKYSDEIQVMTYLESDMTWYNTPPVTEGILGTTEGHRSKKLLQQQHI
ncbi:hypothetical protein Tco_0725799 [Tanacetum coccineum]|uniref:Uncharacterized protein n=1 Tax=Tanacetum coccineum TaxID=301880 RepID=A0ABQ4YG33_9ASTR